MNEFQDLSKFVLPSGFRGRSAVYVQIWWAVQATLFRHSPQFAYGFRRLLLRFFGARIGRNVIIRPSVRITYPWKLSVGDYSWIGDFVELYSLAPIVIGSNSVISQYSYLCAGDHDYSKIDFPIRGTTINISDEVWVAAGVFIAPGTSIGRGAVVGARSSVFADLPSGMICIGSPCRPIRPRRMHT